MMRKVFVSVLVIVTTLVLVPSVLAALTSPSAFGASFKHGNAVSLPATYRLKARVAGDLRFAGRLSVVATRRSDGATIFSGPITRLARFDLGRFGAGQQETLRLRVMLTSTGTDKGDKVLQGRSASVAFTWTATQA